MKKRRTIRLSDAERAARSARLRALQADPAFQAARRAAIVTWSVARRAAQAELLRRQNADPNFIMRQRIAQDAARVRAVKIPASTHPVVRALFVEMNAQLATIAEVVDRADVGFDTIRFWRFRSMPRVDLLDAALNVLDLQLAVVPIGTRDADGFAKRTGGSK